MYGKGKVIVLLDKTHELLGIEYNELSEGSHKKVVVKCERCGEEITRERRKLHQLHACPTHIVKDGKDFKWCNHCSKFLLHSQFANNSARYDNLSSWCKTCSHELPSSKRHNDQKSNDRKTFDGWIKQYIANKKAGCKRDGMEFGLTIDDLVAQWEAQSGRCYYSKVPLTYGSRTLQSATLERLSSSNAYTKENTVWACAAMNHAKNNATYDDFCEFLLQSDLSSHLPVRCECILKHPDAKIPFKKRTSDVGYDMVSVENKIIRPNDVKGIHTGIHLAVPEGWYYTIEGRSSLFLKGITPFRGIIDATYCGEVVIFLMNASPHDYEIAAGERIAQIILHKQYYLDITEVVKFGPDYDQRGEKGFGSSGR